VEHPHTEPFGAAGDRASDATEPNETERRVVHVAPEVLRSASAVDASRDAARINRNAVSAVVSSSTPGVLHTVMPCAAAVRTSMLS
jgi:hypothetical protein